MAVHDTLIIVSTLCLLVTVGLQVGFSFAQHLVSFAQLLADLPLHLLLPLVGETQLLRGRGEAGARGPK